MGKTGKAWLISAAVIAIMGIYSIAYNDAFLGEIASIGAIAVFIKFLLRKIKYKGEVQTDEMFKRVSGISSDFAFLITVLTIAILSILLHYYPEVFNAEKILVILLITLVVSKIACHLYYLEIKKEICF